MRIRLALPLLATVVAVFGLRIGTATSQDTADEPAGDTATSEPNAPPVPNLDRVRRPARPRGVGALAQAPVRPAPRPGGAPPTVQPAAPIQNNQGPATNQTPAGNGISQFETGIDFSPMSPSARVTFNIENADLPELVRLISNITGRRFILPGKARTLQATVFAPTQVTVSEAYQAFLSILEVNGMTVVPAGRYLKIVETGGIENQPLPTYPSGTAVPADDRYVTRLHRVENIAADDVAQLLTRFKSREGNIGAYAPTNMVIITDTGANIRRMMRILEAVDVPRGGEQLWIEPIHYANASEIATRLQEIFPTTGGGGEGGGAGGAAPARAARNNVAPGGAGNSGPAATVGQRGGDSRVTKILPDERTNSLIIVATERAYLRILELIRQLDVPLEGEGRIHVHPLQHSDAEEVANTIQSLIGGGQGGGQGGARQGRQGGPNQAPPPSAPGGMPTGDGFEGEIRITAHKPNNALVITSSLHDYAAIRRVIDRLDVPRRQVFIEAVIMELEVSRTNELGLSFHGGIPGLPTDGSLSVVGLNAQNTAITQRFASEVLTGMAVGVRGPDIPESAQLLGQSVPAFGVALKAIATDSDTNVLSTPHLIAMDNVQAEINIGQNVPLQTGFSFPGFGGFPGVGAPGATGQTPGMAGLGGMMGMGMMGMGGFGGGGRQDVGTIIRVTPHINEFDEIRMELEQEISSAGAPEGQIQARPINRRTAKTELVVRDQQTVVIGGLMEERLTSSRTKIPVLGDIPLLGALFRQTTKQKRKSNLLLFLTPYIIRDPSDLRSIYERKLRERQEFLDRYFVFEGTDYRPPVDYSRTRGLLTEIFSELAALEAERELYSALEEDRPQREHVPRAPVGSAADLGATTNPGDTIIGPDDAQDGEGEPPPEPPQIEPPPEQP